jgi:hypothetical protein
VTQAPEKRWSNVCITQYYYKGIPFISILTSAFQASIGISGFTYYI